MSAKKSIKRAARDASLAVKEAVENPKRTARKVAAGVHKAANRAAVVGDVVISAGQAIKKTAKIVDSLADRVDDV
jgi:hypothetical protein